MTGQDHFGPMLPGLDFLQNLMKSAGSAMPGMAPWITPTLDPAELDKRIADLRTVQFWLEQNARLMATTIQTLEVQRMTLSTLHNLNLSVGDLGEAFKLKESADGARAPQAGAGPTSSTRGGTAAPTAETSDAAAGAVIDPVQWWSALTQQFTEIAAKAMRDGAAAAGGTMAAATAGAEAATAAPASAGRPSGRPRRTAAPKGGIDGAGAQTGTRGTAAKTGARGAAARPDGRGTVAADDPADRRAPKRPR